MRELPIPVRAFALAALVAVLGGLIGLGGAEFRLPILIAMFALAARRAVPVNLAISLATVAAALMVRLNATPAADLLALAPAAAGLVCGAMLAASFGARLVHRLSERALHGVIVGLLAVLGAGMILDAHLSHASLGLLRPDSAAAFAVGALVGLGVGLVSTLLGVAGGELLIPTFVFLFGVDIKTAGAASLLVSLPVIVVGLTQHARLGAFADSSDLRAIVAPMALGSILGAPVGGLLVGLAPAYLLKLALGAILLWSAFRLRSHATRPAPARS